MSSPPAGLPEAIPMSMGAPRLSNANWHRRQEIACCRSDSEAPGSRHVGHHLEIVRMSESYDLIVIGTGAGGSGVATRCRKAGWRVAIVDDEPYGGTCALRGCDPK